MRGIDRAGRLSAKQHTRTGRRRFPAGRRGVGTENGQPRRSSSVRGWWFSAKGPVSRILSCAVIPLGAALPRTLISNLPGGFGNSWNRLSRIGPIRRAARLHGLLARPSLFGLAPCGVYRAPDFTAGAVRSYRTFSPLPRRVWSLLQAGGRSRPEGTKASHRGGFFSVALAVREP